MERKIKEFFSKWKTDVIRKPMILYGSKQIGKTFSALEFGKEEYKNVVYFNTDNNKKIIELFKKERSTEKIILNLSLEVSETILKDDTLIILDNVNSIDIIKGLKLFGSEHSNYHIIAITSRKENLKDFKGEELLFKAMSSLDFEEYLWAHNEKNMAELIKESFTKRKTCPFHKLALDYFTNYLQTGGMPEVIKAELEGKTPYELDAIKQKIIDVYKKEVIIAKNIIDIPRAIEVIDSLPEQLSKDNKKFQYGVMGAGKRAKEYESCIDNLVNNQIIYKSHKIKEMASPLSSNKDKDCFKLYAPDVGLLYTMMHLNYKQLVSDENVKETLYENHIAKSLVENGYTLYYYQSDGKAEVNFVVQNRMGQIIPIEITIKTNSKAKSLSVFVKKYTTPVAFRMTENNFSTKKGIRYIPVYAAFCLENIKF